MAQVSLDGREVTLTEGVRTGEEVRKEANIPSNRTLFVEKPEGRKIIGDKERIRVEEGDSLGTVGNYDRG
jgi:hypothetical protein